MPETVSREVLLAIRAQDPDGKETEPTDAAYKQFEEWVLSTYGAEALAQYFEWNDEGTRGLPE